MLLVTSESLRHADWPVDSVDEFFYVPDVQKRWRPDDFILGASHLARRERIDRVGTSSTWTRWSTSVSCGGR